MLVIILMLFLKNNYLNLIWFLIGFFVIIYTFDKENNVSLISDYLGLLWCFNEVINIFTILLIPKASKEDILATVGYIKLLEYIHNIGIVKFSCEVTIFAQSQCRLMLKSISDIVGNSNLPLWKILKLLLLFEFIKLLFRF
jgi:hypothetical protein